MLVVFRAVVVFAGMVGAHRGEPVEAPPARVEAPSVSEAAPVGLPGLHNVVRYPGGVLSGGVPEGGAAFDTLKSIGVATVISVDGAEPDVEAARARGLRYIHLPVGYNGFDRERLVELSRAVRDAMREGGVYLHCHHGKHRSAAAAAAVAVSLGWASAEEAVARMKVSGTAPTYAGLYACARGATPLSEEALAAAPAAYPEVAKPAGMVRGMLELDDALDHLRLIERAGWETPADHPDLVPAAEAGRLADVLRLLGEGTESRAKGDAFVRRMAESADRARSLEEMLAGPRGPADLGRLSERLDSVSASCKSCHAAHRD